MNVLALDSATEALVVSLQAGARLYTRSVREGLRHAQTLVPQVEQILSQASLAPPALDLVVVGVGPGSFTGLRIALAAARGLARGASCPIAGVCTLDALAWPLQAWPGLVVPVVDARKGRVYAALYRQGRRVSGLLDVGCEQLGQSLCGEPAVLTGPYAREAASCPDLSWCTVDPAHVAPDPAGLLALGIAEHTKRPDSDVAPVYLRRSEAEVSRR